MKKTLTLSISCFLFVASIFAQDRRCATMENLEYRKQQDPQLEQRMSEIESFTQAKVAQMGNQANKISGNVITIPVVVHVLYRNSTENISVAQIQSQLDVLNEDFRRTNSDADNSWSQAADTEIEFCLSTVDPNGNATTGITRKSTTRQDWGANDDAKRSSTGGINPWDTSEYLNMWVVPKMTTVSQGQTINLLGYAQFPGGSAATDGLVMIYNAFGRTGAVSAPYDGGRTTTHEIGHYLNLRHIWGDANCGNDFVSDTPTHQTSNSGCPVGRVSCSSTDMPQNYMDYTNDSCMNLFTLGQKNRMRSVLEAGGSRRSLALSDKCGAAATPTCSDGVQNGNETGVDCGGSCEPCQTVIKYCDSQGGNVNDEYISRVQLEGINNASGAQFYSDFTNVSTNLDKGSSYTLTVTPTWTGSNYSEGYAAWIDYNEDGDFTDAGEQIFSKAKSTTSPVNGTFTVPAGTSNGDKRMRVSMKYDGIPTSCESFQYGEVEDYTVVISAATGDTQAPSAPANLSASNIAQTTATLTWAASTDNVAVTAYEVFSAGASIGNVTGTSANLTGLTANTSYSYTVKAMDEAGNVSSVSNTANFTTLPIAQVNYCGSEGSDSSYEWIDYVAFGGMTNSTGDNGGYADFTSKVATASKGATSTITISAGFKSSAYTEHWAIYIDLNQNGSFDSNEKLVSGSSSSAGNLTANVAIPSTALVGQTRMRVSMKYDAAQTACETFSYGEVEDYTVNITNGTRVDTAQDYNARALGNESNVFDFTMYPNPVNNMLNVKLHDTRSAEFTIKNMLGQTVNKGNLSSAINVSALQAGIYLLEVNDGQKSMIKKFIKQ